MECGAIKVLTVFGTRPEAVKMAPLIKELEKHSEFQTAVCVTAQHREMLDQVLELFDIKPDYDLDIMKSRQDLTDITVNALTGLVKVIGELNPDVVLVHGDTTTTFAASLAAYYCKKAVGHVEAGLRTYNKYFPYPEEMNRRLTTCIAELHFAPTQANKANLLKEGIEPAAISVTGNTVIDALKERPSTKTIALQAMSSGVSIFKTHNSRYRSSRKKTSAPRLRISAKRLEE